MSMMSRKLIKDLLDAFKASEKNKTTGYDTSATVKRIENGTAWVHIPGGVDETPAKLTINANVGDIVQVRVSGGKAFLIGNGSAPPTDDTTAIKATRVANKAHRTALQASEEAAEAWNYAGIAAEAAISAQTSADSASQAADRAWEHADEANQAATEAKESARSANNSANNALVQLSVVEDVAGTLRWISEHGDYVLTEDDHVVSGTVYFIYQNGDYIPIAQLDPSANPSQEGWYVLDVTESQAKYIMAHLAVTSAGLWVLPVNQLAEHPLVDSEGDQLIDSDNNPIVDFSEDPQHATGYKVLLSGGGGQTGDFPIGLTIYNDEGEAVANYGVTTTIGAVSGKHLFLDTDSADIKDGNDILVTFGETVIIGKNEGGNSVNYARAVFDYHSMKLYPKGYADPYFEVNDLRDESGYSTVTERFIIEYASSGTETVYVSYDPYLDGTPTVTVQGVDVTGDDSVYTWNKGMLPGRGFTFNKDVLPNPENIVMITYQTATPIINYTFGTRSANNLKGSYSVVEGMENTGLGTASHAEGRQTEALGAYSHSEGLLTQAGGDGSHAQNIGTVASSVAQTAMGRYNEEDTEGKYLLIIGNGTLNARSNAFTVDWDGNVFCGSMDSGYISAATFGSVPASSSKEYNLTFNKTFTSAPIVVASFVSSSTAGSGLGSCTITVHSITTTGCTLKIFNNDSTSARNPAVNWIAMLT